VLLTSDGIVSFYSYSSNKDWKLQCDIDLEDHIFSTSTLDITGDGEDEVVACSWDGVTFIFNHRREVVKFDLGNGVRGFCTGQYSFTGEKGKTEPCFIYVTLEGHVWVYYDIKLHHLSATSTTQETSEIMTEFPDLLNYVERVSEGASSDPSFVYSLLYHLPTTVKDFKPL